MFVAKNLLQDYNFRYNYQGNYPVLGRWQIFLLLLLVLLVLLLLVLLLLTEEGE